jgi:hypothetical protein
MRAFRFFNTAVFCAVLGGAIAVYAQQPQEEQHDQAKPPEQQEPKREEARPPQDQKTPKHEEAKPPKQEQPREEQAKPREQKPEHPGQQAQHARPAGKSAHIPDDKFRAHFGRQHTFVVNRPVVVQGQPQFVFSGYTFVLLDPWPVEWVYTDDCYIDYIDGDYFLFDVLHPGVRIALFVVI